MALATTPNGRDQGKPSSLYSASISGVILTLLGAVLASLKSVATAALQKAKSPLGTEQKGRIGLGLSALQLICYISPLALLQSLLYAYIAGELSQLPSMPSFLSLNAITKDEGVIQGFSIDSRLLLFLFLNCLAAFGLNIASFEANRRVGALGITIAGNVKQVLIFAIGVVMGGEEWTTVRWIGVFATVGGSCWFVMEERREERKRTGPNAEIMEDNKIKKKDGPSELEKGVAKP